MKEMKKYGKKKKKKKKEEEEAIFGNPIPHLEKKKKKKKKNQIPSFILLNNFLRFAYAQKIKTLFKILKNVWFHSFSHLCIRDVQIYH
jgi:hypothetical protein